jgi:hypothetical protein
MLRLPHCGVAAVLGLASAWSATATAETLRYWCLGDRDESVYATVSFDTAGPGDKLKTLTMANVPLTHVPEVMRFKGIDAETSTGENSEDKYRYYKWVRTHESQEWTYSLSYKSHHLGERLTLDESLVGANEAVDGTPYGKLRIDVAIEELDDVGMSLIYECKRY